MGMSLTIRRNLVHWKIYFNITEIKEKSLKCNTIQKSIKILGQNETHFRVADDYSQNNFGQTESRDGYNTQGEYYVNLPDGRLQKVTYTVAGDAGYVADVVYTGEAQYPPEPAGGYVGRRR